MGLNSDKTSKVFFVLIVKTRLKSYWIQLLKLTKREHSKSANLRQGFRKRFRSIRDGDEKG